MADESIRVFGLKELEGMLLQLETKGAKKLVKQALRVGAKSIQQIAKAKAPKRTGKLAKSIRVRAGKSKGDRVSVKVVTSDSDNLYTGTEFYGAFQEFGWMKVPTFVGKGGQIKSMKRGTEPRKKIEGRHFMHLAAEAGAQTAIDRFAEKLSQTIPLEIAKKKS